jgi:hypothetical protein
MTQVTTIAFKFNYQFQYVTVNMFQLPNVSFSEVTN